MDDNSQGYNVAAVYEMLMAAVVDGQELQRLCRFNGALRPALKRFGPDQGLDDMADEVIGYCQTQRKLGDLVAAVKAHNPAAYADFEARLLASGVPLSTVAPVSSTPFNLPADLDDFTGRQAEVAELRRRLAEGVTVVMAGMGGVGKTALAVHVAHGLAAEGRFKDAQLYINLCGTDPQPLEPAAALGALLTAVAGLDPNRPADVKALTERWQKAMEDKDAVLILDNAADAAQIRPLLPGDPTCATIVTSLQRFTLSGSAGLMDIDRLPAEEARALLQTLAPRLDDAGADEIARLCGGLPLALRIAGNYLAVNNDCSAGEYAERLAGERALAQLSDSDDQSLDVAAAIGLSVNQLDEEMRQAWALLGLLPAPFDVAAAKALWNASEETAVLDRLRALRNRSLLSYVDKAIRYDQHDLLRLAAMRDLKAPSPPEEDRRIVQETEIAAARERLARHYLGVARAADQEQRYLALNADWPHLRAGLDAARAAGIGGQDPSLLSDLVYSLKDYWSVQGMAGEWAAWSQRAAEACAVAGRRQDEGTHLGNLGIAYKHLGKVRQAIGYYEQALAIARKVGDRRGEGADLGNLGAAHAHLGELQRAIGRYEQALAIAQEIRAASTEGSTEWKAARHDEGVHLGSLGRAYANLGEGPRAISYCGQALAIAREIGDQRSAGIHLGSLGRAHANLSEGPRAIDYYNQALDIHHKIGDRRFEGIHLGSLGLAYAAQGDVQRAIGNYERALAIAREIGDRRYEGIHLGSLGLAYAAQGDVQRAIGHHDQALAIAREIGNRRNEGIALANLGLAYKSLGNMARARELWAEALRIYEEIEDPHAERVRGWLAEHDTDSHG